MDRLEEWDALTPLGHGRPALVRAHRVAGPTAPAT